MKYTSLVVAILASLVLLPGCELEEVIDPNRPDISTVSQNATQTQLNTLAVGILAGIRNGHGLYVTSTGSVARELYLFNADPRNTGDLLGKNGTQLDNNSFYLVTPYNSRYQVVKTTNVLLDALENINVVPDAENTENLITEAEKRGYEAFAKTIQAHELLQVLNMLGSNGIRIDVTDIENLGEFVSEEAALAHIAGLLDEAQSILAGGNVEFVFPLAGFGTRANPAGFLQFNRALAARVAAYRENWAGVLTHLDDSFFGLDVALNEGPQMEFSFGPGDILNPLYKAFDNTGDMIFAHASWVQDAEAGDRRVANKVREAEIVVQDELSGRYRTTLYESSITPISIIRNEELILLYAEANIQLNNFDEAVEALDVIRNAAGLPDYSGARTREALIDEMLKQRRYSLWAEGHRLVDLRRYGRITTEYLPLDREGDQLFQDFPIPLTESI